MKLSQICLALIFVVGCGGGDDSDSRPKIVTDLSLSPGTISQGQISSVKVEFSPPTVSRPEFDLSGNSESDEVTGRFELVVVFPAGFAFVEGSSVLQDSFLGDVVFGSEDRRGPNAVGLCDDGALFLIYQFAENELSADTPAEQFIRFEVRAPLSSLSSSVVVNADFDIGDPCVGAIDQEVSVTVQ